MATKDDRAQIWYTDGSGNVAGYTESVGEIADTIIGAYNEHFGTDIALWTPETKSLQVGDTVPNWNAYEKIELPKQYVRTNLFEDKYAFGFVQSNTLKVYGPASDSFYMANNGGEIFSSAGNASNMINGTFKPRLIAQGYEVESAETEITSYEVGQQVEYWENYVIITS